MAEEEKKKRPKYKHKEGKCDSECKYCKAGYCKITGTCVELTLNIHNLATGLKSPHVADCEPFLVDLRQDAEKDWPEYQREPEKDIIDESVGEQTLKELRKLNKNFSAFHKNFKKHQEDVRLTDS